MNAVGGMKGLIKARPFEAQQRSFILLLPEWNQYITCLTLYLGWYCNTDSKERGRGENSTCAITPEGREPIQIQWTASRH